MNTKNKITAAELENVQAMVNESRSYRSHPSMQRIRIRIPESAMLFAPAGSQHALPWRTIYNDPTEKTFGESGRYFLLTSNEVQDDGSVRLFLQKGKQHLLDVYVAADCEIAWRRA